MVFSRYSAVIRCAGNFLRPRILDAKVNATPERSFSKASLSFRAESARDRPRTDFVPSSEKIPSSSIIPDDEKNLKGTPHVFQHTRRPPSSFESSTATEHGPRHSFRANSLVPDDASTEQRIAVESDESEDFVSLENYIPEKSKGPLETCDEDLSHITPYHRPSFNFAAYADESKTIQELAKLGVEFFKLETDPKKVEVILQKNYEDIKPYIRFLHDSGVPAERIGAFLTKNPFILNEDMDDLHTRIRYLRAHKFEVDMIARIVTQNPLWLSFNTKRIDRRLGFFQNEFSLSGSNVRYLATKQPRLITYSMKHVRENNFAVREEMGFDADQTKSILLTKPRLFMKCRKHIVAVFDYAHNTMKLPHDLICSKPQLLTCRLHRLQMRHRYLETLGKNQYDPTKPLYVSPEAIVSGTDVDFCLNVAKTTVGTYNLFMKNI